jgi:hypothetical protein
MRHVERRSFEQAAAWLSPHASAYRDFQVSSSFLSLSVERISLPRLPVILPVPLKLAPECWTILRPSTAVKRKEKKRTKEGLPGAKEV